ncbi:MAG: transcription antitermination factor NusB [Ilumatobacteraceae bacterium]|jgi:N utilization substance protein B
MPAGGDPRTESRERALTLLYESEARGVSVDAVLAARPLAGDELAMRLARGVEAARDEIDAVIGEHSHAWTLARMPAIDRNVLRLAVHELLHRPDVPVGAVIDEAVGLAKRFSTDDSGRFVNGVLSAVARTHRKKGG